MAFNHITEKKMFFNAQDMQNQSMGFLLYEKMY